MFSLILAENNDWLNSLKLIEAGATTDNLKIQNIEI
jgi:hypothetical protein